MFEISDNFLTSNPLIAIILLVVCGLFWKLLGLAFDKITKSKDKENEIFLAQLKELTGKFNDNADKLAEVICDLRILIEQFRRHDDMIDNINTKIENHEHSIAKHDVRISVLENSRNG